jgi:hypothetical protein
VDTEINELIETCCFFSKGQIKPILFRWRKKLYQIQKIVFQFHKKIGQEEVFYFSVETGVNACQLEFNSERQSWKLLKIFS